MEAITEEKEVETQVDPRIAALAKFLECDPSDIDEEESDARYSVGNKEYLVLTDSEADEMAHEDIKQSLWAFNADFLAAETALDSKVFTALAELCEGANEAVLSLIEANGSFKDFADAAISADGRGHFMSSYDGEENEEGDYYIYRTN